MSTAAAIKKHIKEGTEGFYIGSRMILPFKCQFIKLIVDNHIITEFVGNSNIKVSQEKENTSIYFREAGKLNQFEGSYECIKMIISGLEDDLCDRDNHLKVIFNIKENYTVQIGLAEDNKDILFID